MTANRVVLSAAQIERLKAFAAMNLPLQTAARQLGMNRATVAAALDRQGYGPWMDENFPSRQGQGSGGSRKGKTMPSKVDGGQMRKLKPEQIQAPLNVDAGHIRVRSAAMPWRASV